MQEEEEEERKYSLNADSAKVPIPSFYGRKSSSSED